MDKKAEPDPFDWITPEKAARLTKPLRFSCMDKAEAKSAEERFKLTDDELAKALEVWAHDLAESGGRKWTLRIPVDFNNDPDMLMCEAAKRLRDASQAVERYKDEVKAKLKLIIDPYPKGEFDDGKLSAYSDVLELLDTTGTNEKKQ